MSRGYSLTPEARANVNEICAFIAEDNLDAALHVLEALEHAFELLAATPEISHKRNFAGETTALHPNRSEDSRVFPKKTDTTRNQPRFLGRLFWIRGSTPCLPAP